MSDVRNIIAKNIAPLLHKGDLVNLGVGIPTLVCNYIAPEEEIMLHGENGSVGLAEELPFAGIYDTPETLHAWQSARMGRKKDAAQSGHKDLVNAGGNVVTLLPQGCCFDSCISFGIARGGHLDATVLGGMEVDESGNLANWMVPGKRVSGMGGAMDLVAGAKKVIVAMEHCTKEGEPKLLHQCRLPLTGMHCVDYVVTELCVIKVTKDGFRVVAMYPGITKEMLQEKTEAKLSFAEEIKAMEV